MFVAIPVVAFASTVNSTCTISESFAATVGIVIVEEPTIVKPSGAKSSTTTLFASTVPWLNTVISNTTV